MPKKLSQEEFEQKSNLIFKFKYDYSNAKYFNKHSRLTIICPIHGEFEQKAMHHLQGKEGCIPCRNELRKQTCVEKYGVENVMQVKCIKNKQEQSLYDNHGVLVPYI